MVAKRRKARRGRSHATLEAELDAETPFSFEDDDDLGSIAVGDFHVGGQLAALQAQEAMRAIISSSVRRHRGDTEVASIRYVAARVGGDIDQWVVFDRQTQSYMDLESLGKLTPQDAFSYLVN